MNSHLAVRRAFGILAWLISFHVLLAYGLPEWLFIVLNITLGIVYWRVGAAGAAVVSTMLLAMTLVYGLALKVTGLDERIYYRPDEKYSSFDYADNHHVYDADVRTEMPMLHGDLGAMANLDFAQPRRVRFDTDAEGFRNERNYHGQRYVLVGDSFVAGTDNTQPDVLYAQLLSTYGIDTYSRGYPGNLADYAAYIRSFQRRHGDNFRVLLFLFEGNDFDESRGRPTSAIARWGRRYYSLFSDFSTYRVTMTLYKRYLRGKLSGRSRKGDPVEVDEITGKKIAFYRHYVEVTRRVRLDDVEGFERTLASIRPHLARVYFIPTKYRVYAAHLPGAGALPNAQWDYLSGLCQKYALRCTDLTAPLVQAADASLKNGELIWWQDDTHWNRAGIAVAARIVASDLATANSPRASQAAVNSMRWRQGSHRISLYSATCFDQRFSSAAVVAFQVLSPTAAASSSCI
jgi:hypothetical protein